MFERIVVAIDGSARSEATIAIALDLAQRYDAAVTVVHVREYERSEGTDVDMGPPVPADRLVAEAVERFRAAGIAEVAGEVRRTTSGNTAEQIAEIAAGADASLIVLGSRGMSEWKSLLLGGVANKVVREAHCPVLLVR
ncbi:MAG TPA: universal stress protein [Actinomycetota bacterium]|nr:universal stress protein [Actinomycetota bacterium]